tara:strand:- start:2298 stop:2801 length:504 start_codon:yes stop_codon:yes gene_type:complete
MEENIPNGNSAPQSPEIIQEIWKSESIEKLASALSKAQSEIKGAEKKSTNPFFNSGYADLHTVIESSFPHLTKYGLSVIQGNDGKPGEFYVTTMLLHESGQWIKSKLKMPIEKATAQSIGSTITYGRRYGLSAMVGIAQYDDDGNAASGKGLTQKHAASLNNKQGVK